MIHAIILSITGFQVKSGSFSIVEKIGETTAHLFPFLCTHGTEVIDHKWLIVVWLITVALLVAVSVAFFLMFTFQSRLKAEVRLHTSELDEQNRKLVDEINRRTIAEKTLVESRNLYKTLVENIPQSVFLKDTQSRFISVNRMFAHQVGCAQIEIEGKTDFDFYHPEHAEKYRADDQKVILSGETLIVTEPISYNGLNRWIRTIKTPVRNDQGTIIGVLGVFWDITEEKISSDSILASKLFTERIMTTTPVIVFVHDLFEKKNIYVNEAVIPILGYTPDEVLTLSANFLFQLIHPDDIDCLRDAVRKWGELNDDNETVSIEFRLHHKNGNWLWFMAKDTIFKRNESGKINQIIGTLSDITERKNAETALRSAMDRAQLYLDIVEVIIVALNRNGNISLINRKGCQILGYRLDEILGRNWFATCIPETERQSTEHFFKQLIDGQTENIEYHEYTICSKTGENRIIAWHNSVLHNEAGIVNATLSSGIDITERKFTEKRLIIEERRDHAILEIAQIPNASIQKVIDLSLESALSITESLIGYIYFYNEHSKKFTLFSWSHSVMPQCKIVEKQTTYDLEKTGLWGEAVRQRKPIVTNDYDAPSAFKKGIPSGHVPLGRHMNIPVFDDGEIVAVVGVGNKREPYTDSDVRHLTVFMDGVWKVVRRLEAENHLRELNEDLERTVQERTSELRNAKERAEQADRAKSEFLANMSHELRTPLNAVIGFGELLERQIKDPTHRGYVSSIASSGKNLLRLINDVLDMSKIEANRLELHPISTSIRTLIEDTGTIFQMKLEQKKITFSSIVEKTVPDFLLLDEARLGRFF